ncbi:MAG: hypothetical protein K2N07_06410 [Desulfovibrio sp.]|nr:hypothetical protein [Desulfovibrio sp.]
MRKLLCKGWVRPAAGRGAPGGWHPRKTTAGRHKAPWGIKHASGGGRRPYYSNTLVLLKKFLFYRKFPRENPVYAAQCGEKNDKNVVYCFACGLKDGDTRKTQKKIFINP